MCILTNVATYHIIDVDKNDPYQWEVAVRVFRSPWPSTCPPMPIPAGRRTQSSQQLRWGPDSSSRLKTKNAPQTMAHPFHPIQSSNQIWGLKTENAPKTNFRVENWKKPPSHGSSNSIQSNTIQSYPPIKFEGWKPKMLLRQRLFQSLLSNIPQSPFVDRAWPQTHWIGAIK